MIYYVVLVNGGLLYASREHKRALIETSLVKGSFLFSIEPGKEEWIPREQDLMDLVASKRRHITVRGTRCYYVCSNKE